MNTKEVLKYISLIDRRLQILLNSEIECLPKYGNEMHKIDMELVQIRKLFEADQKEGV